MTLREYISEGNNINEEQDKLAKLFKQGKTHKFYFTKAAGKKALKEAEMERIEKSLNLAIDRKLGITRGFSYEKGRKLFNVKKHLGDDYEETDEVMIWSNFGIRDGSMDEIIKNTLTKLGYKLDNDIGQNTFKTKLKNESTSYSFKEYLEEQESHDIDSQLNESIVASALVVLGLASIGLVVTWGSLVVVKGYVSLMNKSVSGIVKAWKGIFKKRPKQEVVRGTVMKMKSDQAIKVLDQKEKKLIDKFDGKLDSTIQAIKDKDPKKASEELKKSGIPVTPVINRIIVEAIVKTLGEPPIHYGNTGNEAYLFVKSILGIKVAKVTAAVVKEALNKHSADLIQDVE